MGSLRQLSEHKRKTDLAKFVEAHEDEIPSFSLRERDVAPASSSYQVHCQFQAPFLSAFILNEIGILYIRSNIQLAHAEMARAIFHLYSGSDAASGYYTAPAWRFARTSDKALLNLFLANCRAYEITVGRKKILDRLDGSIFSETAEYCETWNVLVEAAVYNPDSALLRQIADRYPAAVPPALEALSTADKLLNKFPRAQHFITSEEIQNARYQILLALKSPLHDDYKVSYEDKRFVEKVLLSKIENLPSTRAILDFYSQYYGAFVVMQHRYYCLAYVAQRLFQRSELSYPTIRVKIVEALQKKFYEKISNVMDSEMLEESLMGLFKESHSAAGVSAEWRNNVISSMKFLAPAQVEMQAESRAIQKVV